VELKNLAANLFATCMCIGILLTSLMMILVIVASMLETLIRSRQ
jgi:hypothetical protein